MAESNEAKTRTVGILLAIVFLVVVIGAGAAAKRYNDEGTLQGRFSASDYPNIGTFRNNWNRKINDSLGLSDWSQLDKDVWMSQIGATKFSAAFNAQNNAFGVIGPDSREHGYLCASLFDKVSEEGENITILNTLMNDWTGSGVTSLVRSEIEYRFFQIPGNPDITCNIQPALGRQDTVSGKPSCENTDEGRACVWVVASTQALGTAEFAAREAATSADAAARVVQAATSRVPSANVTGLASHEVSASDAAPSRQPAVDADVDAIVASEGASDAAEKAADARDAAAEAERLQVEVQNRRKYDEAQRVAAARARAAEELEQRALEQSRKEADALARLQADHAAKLDAEDDPVRK